MSNREDLPSLMTVREVAAASRRSPSTIRRRVQLGLEPQPIRREGPGIPLLFTRESVRRWLFGGMKSGRPQGGRG